jgi:hypothetical protein
MEPSVPLETEAAPGEIVAMVRPVEPESPLPANAEVDCPGAVPDQPGREATAAGGEYRREVGGAGAWCWDCTGPYALDEPRYPFGDPDWTAPGLSRTISGAP